MANQTDVKDLVARYKQKLQSELELKELGPSERTFTREYKEFKKEAMPKTLTLYEKACNFCEKILKIKVKPEKAATMQESIEICHLSITPTGVQALAYLLPIAIMLLGAAFSLLIGSLFFVLIFLLFGLALIVVLNRMPDFLANNWRMKASNQMVLCIFYVVTFMRHTSNLENAIEFASDHLSPPLSLDLKKVIWDVEAGKYESVKASLDAYLETWKKWNNEFVEAFHLVESSLYETSDERRLAMLDKSLDVILTETYEKMLHYAQNLKSPITMLHMMGVILPILGLVILPLIVSFMENVKWWHIATLYNVILPVVVYYLGKSILSKRPTGYGDTDISEINPELKKYKNIILNIGGFELQIQPIFICIIIGAFFALIALTPLVLHTLNPSPGFDINLPFGIKLLEYRESNTIPGKIIGPFGLGAALLSLCFPLALAFSIGLYYRLRSKNIIKIREQTKKLEDEFASALFQLGNRLGDGLPAEIAFQKVANVMGDTTSGNFFKLVSDNIAKLGMSVKEAIFNPKTGALVYFPSNIIQSSMQVLIQSIRKGPIIAAQALMNISRYIKEIHKVNERLKDLMADVISDMKSQIHFLTPAISGVVIGITSMITYILGALSGNIQNLGSSEIGGKITDIASLFGDGIPTYYFQAVIGIYVFQIVYLLTQLSNGIENGADKLGEKNALGHNLIRSTVLYCLIAAVVMLIFNMIASRIVDVTGVIGG
ncbi:hypothetical protein KY338_02125 [Candidatus Woesearchaeota archaeon]|nr:hypothetical protein [Candidatus Woesearchaeota archaeon]MBW3006088.1 hypothetical protein [Candidatus Woesearchaeota archaeon]